MGDLVGRFSPQFCIGGKMSDEEFFKEMIERDLTLRVDKEIREATTTVIAFSILINDGARKPTVSTVRMIAAYLL